MTRESVLFVCTHNSARSQMAEGFLRSRGGDRYQAYSAGTHPSRVHPMAVRVMHEVGVDVSKQRSEHVDLYRTKPLDYVVTVCDDAAERCPYVPAIKRNIHRAFEDPSRIAAPDEAVLAAFRRVRGAIGRWVEQTFLLP